MSDHLRFEHVAAARALTITATDAFAHELDHTIDGLGSAAAVDMLKGTVYAFALVTRALAESHATEERSALELIDTCFEVVRRGID